MATIHAVLEQAQQAVAARRTAALSAAEFPILVVDALHHRYRRRAQRGPREGVLLVAVGVRRDGSFAVLDWLAAPAETTAAYEQLFTRLWQRGLERVELLVSDGAEAIASAAAVVYPS
ncbi:MAG: transposase, partial [Planctomycetota bacterium]